MVEVGRDTQRFYKVSTHSDLGGSTRRSVSAAGSTSARSGQFRSDALDMEVELSERLGRLDPKSLDPAIRSQRRRVLSDVLDQIILKDQVYGTLLARIKEEMDQEGSNQGTSSNSSTATVELQIEVQQLQHALTKSSSENAMQAREMEMLKRECSELRHLLKLREEELEAINKAAGDEGVSSHKQHMLGERIADLEKNMMPSAGRDSGSLPGWSEVDKALLQKEKLEEQLITLTAELRISQRREKEANQVAAELRASMRDQAIKPGLAPVHIPT